MSNNNMLKRVVVVSLLLFLCHTVSVAQEPAKQLSFSVKLVTEDFAQFPALHSFVCGVWEGKWVLIGGRKDGLHRRQPWASFWTEDNNDFVYVIDPVKKQIWKKALSKLAIADSLVEQLRSTNMQFYQQEKQLIVTGGYAYSKLKDDHITFPYITVIDLPKLITSVVGTKISTSIFLHQYNEQMAVTGGKMAKAADGKLLLIGGHRFDGRYNPMGPDHGPGFTQVYTNEIRKFNLSIIDTALQILNYQAINDTDNLHRRDYNLAPQIFANGKFGHTIFSGVFQYEKDIPYTSIVDVWEDGYFLQPDFEQKLSHYHSALTPLYSAATQNMYTIFWGGIAQYYPDAKGKIKGDEDVPFTKTVSLITRNGNTITENYLPVQMPGFLGAAAEFIINPALPIYKDGIIDIDKLPKGEQLIGYIVGGIKSSAPNIFWENTGKESSANNKIIKVYLQKK
jgi:hypothetical protein